MTSIVSISDYVHISYEKNFRSSDEQDITGEPYLVLQFIYYINGEMVEGITVESRHQFAECNSSSIRAYIRENEPLPLYIMLDPEDAENDSEKIPDVVFSLVSQCVGVNGLKMLHVDIIVEINQEEEDDVVVTLNDVELLRERRINMLVKNVYNGEGMMKIDNGCAICLNEMRVGEKIVCTPCVHRFHEDCLGRWFEKAGNCPLCRLKIEPF